MSRSVPLRLAAGALSLALLAGCAPLVHGRELSALQTVQTLGFDGVPGAVTVSASDSRSASEPGSVRLSAAGDGVVRAVERLQRWSAREELFFAHVRYVVVGEDAARAGTAEILDWFERSTQTRLRLPVFVVRGGTAEALVTRSDDEEYEITALLASLERDAEHTGAVHCFTLLDMARRLARSGAALCCAVTAADADRRVPSAEGAVVPLPAGYAVFRDGALAGWLDAAESRGASLLLGLARELDYVLPDGEGTVTVTLRAADVSLRPGWDGDGVPVLSAQLRCRAGVSGVAGSGALDADRLARLEGALAEALARDAEAALAAERALGADFLELGRLFRAADGRERAALLAALRWELRCAAAVERSYDITDAPALRGEGGNHG